MENQQTEPTVWWFLISVWRSRRVADVQDNIRDGIEVELRHVGRCRFALMRRLLHFYAMFSVNV
jgi:hypothetical protein